MRTRLAAVGLSAAVLIAGTTVFAQSESRPQLAVVAQAPKGPPAPPERPPAPHRTGELECRNCHLGEHQGVVQMYIGIGGRGAPTIPSHMFQVRVECIACHTTPKAAEGTMGLSGQTFRPSEQACVGCHGEEMMTGQKLTRGQWEKEVDKMVRWGAQVKPEDREALIDFLAGNFK